MSERAREMFQAIRGMKAAVVEAAPSFKEILGDVKAELSRLSTQGSMELSSAIFNGTAFVPYGPGQYTPTPEHSQSVQGHDMQQSERQQEQDRGREM